MPKLTIDGREIEVVDGTSVLEAAKSLGIEIPHYCYHPGLSIAGNCRMCLVEVEKAPKLMISCDLKAQDGMVVHTRTEKVLDARRAMMEFFLIHHPLDCPICDQAGECHLQEYAVEHGPGESRYTEPKKAMAKAVDIGEHILLDQERCIRCSRCIRFCDEITETGELTFFKRGEVSQIGIFPGKRLDNAYSGNVVDICPVGALTLKEFRFQARVWDLQNTDSVCAGCARGCNVVIATHAYDHYQVGRIRRITPRYNPAINGHWICDEGRLSYLRLDAAPRLETAEGPAGTALEWDEAVVRAAAILKAAAERGKAAAILSPRLTSENLYAWKRLFDGLGNVRAGVRKLTRGQDDDILIRADKGANSNGAASILGEDASEDAILDAIRSGDVDTLVVIGDPLDPDDTATLTDAEKGKLSDLLYVGPFVSGAASAASVLLPAAAWSEEDGTFVNFQGVAQKLRRATASRNEARPGWRTVCDLAAAAGLEFPEWTSVDEVREAMAGNVKESEGN